MHVHSQQLLDPFRKAAGGGMCVRYQGDRANPTAIAAITAQMFGCTRREVYKARVHAAVYGTGVRPRAEEKRKRQRLSVNTVNFLTPCTVDQAYVYHHSPSARFRRPAASDLASDRYVWLPAG